MRKFTFSILVAAVVPMAGCSGGSSSVGSSMLSMGQALAGGVQQMAQAGQTQNAVSTTMPATPQPNIFAQLTGNAAAPAPAQPAAFQSLPATPANLAATAAPSSTVNPLAANVPSAATPTDPTQATLGNLGGMLAQAGQANVNVPGFNQSGLNQSGLNQPGAGLSINQGNAAKPKKGLKMGGLPQKTIAPPRAQPAKLIAPPANKTLAAGTATPATPATPGKVAQPTATIAKPPVKPAVGKSPAVKPARMIAKKPIQHFVAKPRPQTPGRPAGTNGIIGTSPDDGSTEMDFAQELLKSMSLSSKDDNALGQSVGVSLTNQYGVAKSDALTKYVSLVGLTVATSSQRPDIEYVFGVLDTPTINAFSGPNGYIFVTRGALENMQDEAELAGVLAHEISHVILEHGLAQVKQAAGNKALLDAAQIVDGHNNQLNQFADAAVEAITNAGYSQPQEFDADASAVVLMSAAGYNPTSYLHFLQRMQTLQKPGGTVMSTHPGAADRVEKITQQLQPAGDIPQTGATLADRFKANVKF